MKGSEGMQLLSISVSDKCDTITTKLKEQYKQLEEPSIGIDIEQLRCGETNQIICNINENNLNGFLYENIRLATINVLADYIISQYETKLLCKILNINYCYFSPTERRDILKIAQKNLNDLDCKNMLNSLYNIRRKNIIIKKLMEYFDSNSEINIDGFVTFRLQDYIKDLENIVEKAVDDYLMEREYNEFIRLLKYFVEVQDPKLEIVHIVASEDNKYVLYDEHQNEITNQCIEDFMNEVTTGEMNYDDLLVSSLITLAPHSVVIHGINNMKNKELLDTIKNVFIGKVISCDDCSLCGQKVKIEEKAPL